MKQFKNFIREELNDSYNCAIRSLERLESVKNCFIELRKNLFVNKKIDNLVETMINIKNLKSIVEFYY